MQSWEEYDELYMELDENWYAPGYVGGWVRRLLVSLRIAADPDCLFVSRVHRTNLEQCTPHQVRRVTISLGLGALLPKRQMFHARITTVKGSSQFRRCCL